MTQSSLGVDKNNQAFVYVPPHAAKQKDPFERQDQDIFMADEGATTVSQE